MTFDWKSQHLEYRKYIEQLKKQAQTPVAQTSLAVVGAFLFAAFLAVAALRPTLITIAALVRSIQDERKIISTLDQKITLLHTAQQKLDDLKGRLGPANSAIPDHVNVADIAQEVEVLASQHELVFLELEQSGFPLYNKAIPTPQPGQIPGVSPLSLRIVAGGSEEAIRTFVDDLEHLDRLVVVKTVDLSGVKPEERTERPYALNADLAVEIFTTQPLDRKVHKKQDENL